MWPTLRLDLDLARFGFPVVFGFYIWPTSVFKKTSSIESTIKL